MDTKASRLSPPQTLSRSTSVGGIRRRTRDLYKEPNAYQRAPTFLGPHISPHVDYHGVHVLTHSGMFYKHVAATPWKSEHVHNFAAHRGRVDMCTTNSLCVLLKK
mmetsp:Transcript_32109/g.70277  ORF Transcript_32109/g.70277 Transcript_32109/m.70277 type:complete len:105 (+) Transcript_32109:49-363(+)